EDLALVAVLQVDAAVGAALPSGARHEGQAELDVELEVLERLLRFDAVVEQVPLDELPSAPFVGLRSVEQDHRALRRFRALGRALPDDPLQGELAVGAVALEDAGRDVARPGAAEMDLPVLGLAGRA